MLKNEMESYVRIGGKGLKNLTYPYMGAGEVKSYQNHPYVINEWTLRLADNSDQQWFRKVPDADRISADS